MVFVKVRETYDLHTTKNKMTVIAIHTPKPDIIKRNYPGLLMQCKMYRPVSADVRIACASVLPLDPLGVGTGTGDVAPEDVFNPILYKAMSNKGMSQLEARINAFGLHVPANADVDGSSAAVGVDDLTNIADEFNLYYGLLSDTHSWRHANPQSGLEMNNLRPLVYEMVYNVGDQSAANSDGSSNAWTAPDYTGSVATYGVSKVLGDARPMPFINCTSFSYQAEKSGIAGSGFSDDGTMMSNAEQIVPYLNIICGAIIVPPSKLHEMFYRMVVEWTLEFSQIRSVLEITDYGGIERAGSSQHYQNYSYSETKRALTGDDSSILDNDSCMVSSNVGISKVM